MESSARTPRKVLFLEFNEITWSVIDRLADAGELPTFARLKQTGAWATTEALERPPHLDPWVTWVSIHTGVEQSVHGATVLEQPEITAKRTWDYAVDAGKSVGIFGSISAYPPRKVPGFMVPGPFAPGSETYPRYVEPVQALNRRYTMAHQKASEEHGPMEMAKQGLELLRLGLKPSTCARIAMQLATERVQPHMYWKRVALQPRLNFDVFETLYDRYRPDYATWHSNHAAHYMHHYWRAWDPSGFKSSGPGDEQAKYGDAMPFGYRLCDEILARAESIVDDDTVIVIASSMGQQPYLKDEFPDGRVVVRFKDMKKIIEIIGMKDAVAECIPVMVPEYNLRIPDESARKRAIELLEKATCEGGTLPEAFSLAPVGDVISIGPRGLAKQPDDSIRYFFPDAPNARKEGYSFDELFIADTPTPKQGMHHPDGVLLMTGPGVRAMGLGRVSNLDVAPTVLELLGVEPPAIMPGRALREAWGGDDVPRPSQISHAVH